MSNEVTTPNKTGLGALGALRTGLANVRAKLPEAGGKGILRMLQEADGWVFGQEDNALPLGTEVAINPLSIKHGYTCWTDRAKGEGKNENLGERLYGLSEQVPAMHELEKMEDPKTGAPCAWKDALTMDMKILDGKHAKTEIVYKPTSVGGMNASRTIIDAIFDKLAEETPFVCPIVKLSQDNYKHASYGKTYVPQFEVVGWMDLEGNEEGADADADEPKAVAKTEEAEPEVEAEAETEADTKAEEAPARRRRRA
jgi:hypothetical protein